jgi:hypothetical protein
MAKQTPAQFIKSLQKSGLVVVMNDKYYFVPLSVMADCLFPDEFQKDAVGVSADYFHPEFGTGAQATALATADSVLFNKLDQALSNFRMADGVRQAIWIDEKSQVNGKDVSKSGASKQVLFVYGDGGNKILVDMTKGGRPSNS